VWRSEQTRMRAARVTLMASVLAAGLAAAGCGGSSTRVSRSSTASGGSQSRDSSAGAGLPRGRTSSQAEAASAAAFDVTIPALLPERWIPQRYTCDGADVSLPVSWSAVPPGTAELAVFVLNLQPVHGRLFFDWALADLSPASHGISAGTLPPGAVVGRNSSGDARYSICPAKRTRAEYFFVKVAALPKPLGARPGFDAEALYRQAERSAIAVAADGGAYKRP
jgi:phosphatidylethanolamine-binding protein (PEBP) family uncharacterized protein